MSQPSESLYRQQAINAHFSHQYGEVFLLPRVNQFWMAGFITVWIVLAGIFVSTQPFAQTVEVKGWISTQTMPVHIRAKESAGLIQAIFVRNGELVTEGQALIAIARQSLSLLGSKRLEQKLKALKQAHRLNINAIVQQQQNMTRDIQSIQQQETLLSGQFQILNQQINNTNEQLATLFAQKQSQARLAKTNLASKSQAQQAHLQWLKAKNNKHAIRLQQSQLTEQLLLVVDQTKSKEQHLSFLENEIEQARLYHQQSLADLSQSLNYTLYAQNTGKVDNLHVTQGDSIELSQQLMQILPQQNKFKGMLSVPANQAGFLLPSQKVKVKIDGFPYQKYGAIDGTIIHISKQVLLPKDTAQMPVRLTIPAYMVEVELANNSIVAEGETWPLSSGMTIYASIQLDHPSVLEWLLGPLYTTLGLS